MRNKSPWIDQLNTSVSYPALDQDISADTVIIGAGISGVMTAYQILRQTQLSVVLVDAQKIAHGATGHNAGQVALYFEKPFSSIVEEYSLDMAIAGQKALLQGYDLIQEAAEVLDMTPQLEACQGYMGIRTLTQLLRHLNNKFLRDAGGAQFDAIMIDEKWEYRDQIPGEYLDLITWVDPAFIRDKLETPEYFPVLLASHKACVNSALLCQNMVIYLKETNPERFRVYEHTPVGDIRLFTDKSIEVWSEKNCIRATDVILCTNGFEHFHIIDLTGSHALELDREFHKNINGLVGYMAGYHVPRSSPSAISYYPSPDTDNWRDEEYYYVTRRTVDESTSLICVGGPDDLVPHDAHYDASSHDPKQAYEHIQSFLRTFRPEHVPEVFDYTWHGLMGFTKSGLRYIGKHPSHQHLWYNLGCNGVGIVSSAHGAWKIGKMLAGTAFPPSIFDPK